MSKTEEARKLYKRLAAAKYYAANAEKVALKAAARYTANPAKYKALKTAWRKANPEKRMAYSIDWYAKNTAKEKARSAKCKLAKQELLAGRPRPEVCEECQRSGRVCFDHCHTTRIFRGWLCYKCNIILGHANDSPDLLIALAEYLKKSAKADILVTINNQNYKPLKTAKGLSCLERKAGRPRSENCEICGRPGRICFDHDHETGLFRGWLCANCNSVLGHADDDPALLRRLARYLRRHAKKNAPKPSA